MIYRDYCAAPCNVRTCGNALDSPHTIYSISDGRKEVLHVQGDPPICRPLQSVAQLPQFLCAGHQEC